MPPIDKQETPGERIARFHAHLDKCMQCRDHPFALCKVGALALEYAATGKIADKETK